MMHSKINNTHNMKQPHTRDKVAAALTYQVRLPATIRPSARDALMYGRWDPIGELLEGLPAVQTTAARHAYMLRRD